MRKTAFVLLASALFFGTASLALANISFDSGAPTDPQSQFFAYCGPSITPFVSGGYYTPDEGGPCHYGLTSQELSSSSIFMGVYKGTPGNSTLIDFDFGPQLGRSVLFTLPNSFGGAQDEDYFNVAVSYDDFGDLLAEDNAFENGGTAPLPYSLVQWKWGVAPIEPTTAPLTVTADTQTTVYGGPIPPLTATLSGFVNGDTLATSDVTGSASCSSSAAQGSVAGSYTINCALGTLASGGHYTFDTFVPGTLTITQAPLTLTANDATAVYGSPTPILSAIVSGFVNGDNATVLSGSASCTTSAAPSSSVGSYTITCSTGTLSAANYTFSTFFPGLFTVTKAPLTVAADNKTMVAGSSVPPLTATLSGFVSGQTLATSDVTGGATCSTSATSASSAGSYPITCSAGSLASGNYSFAHFTAGTLTVVAPPPPGNCLVILNASAKPAVTLSGSASLNLTSCGTYIDSNSSDAVDLSGSAHITASANHVVGVVKKSGSSSMTPAPVASAAKADPYASYPKPSVPSTCTFNNYSTSGAKSVTLSPGTYCGGMSFAGSTNVTFQPGLYILKNGPLSTSGSTQLTGTGVSFFLTGKGAGLNFAGSNTMHLTAPASGPLPGFVFFVDPGTTGGAPATASTFSGASSIYLDGVVYMPSQALNLSGSSVSTGAAHFMAIIASTLSLTGASSLSMNASHPSVLPPPGL